MALSVLIVTDFKSANVSIIPLFVRSLSRTTASEKPAEGTWQVSVVPAQADEVTAEHCPNTKVSPICWI